MNYIVIHRQSNLITGIVASSTIPRDTDQYRFIEATDAAITKYRRLQEMAGDNTDIDIGELMKLSPNVFDALVAGKSGDARPIRQRLRAEATPKYEDREKAVREYIASHPQITVDALADHFLMGDAAARAYLQRYRR
ncbi:hypothetical protein [Pseudomonas sp. Marseille-Q7302]